MWVIRVCPHDVRQIISLPSTLACFLIWPYLVIACCAQVEGVLHFAKRRIGVLR